MIRRYRPQDSHLDPAFGLYCGPHHFVEPGFELHTHDFIEMVIVLRGSGLHLSSYGDYAISAGDVFVIQPDIAHGFADSTGMDIVNFLFTQSFLNEIGRWLKPLAGYHALFVLEPVYRQRRGLRNRLHLSATQLKTAARQVDGINQEMHSRQPGYLAMVKAAWQQLLTWLCRVFSQLEDTPIPFARLADTIAYMEQHYAEGLSLEALAARSHMSKNQFIRVFRQHYHQTPGRYLMQLRIEKARELLIAGGFSMTEIAERCGFNDSNYFARNFRQFAGCSPREFKKSGRGMAPSVWLPPV